MNFTLDPVINSDIPLVSICMVTYNHSQWIGQAIEGVLIQKTTFPFELVISDDCSMDNTADIIKRYALDNPSLIRPRFNNSNKGLGNNFPETLNFCRGKYIAICEGDDFWIDPLKLQIQVDYLEKNPEYVMSSHNYYELSEPNKSLDENIKYDFNFTYGRERYLKDWVTQPVTCVFRNIFRDYTFLKKEDIFCDVILFYELLKHGRGFFFKEAMAAFRIHKTALSSGLSRWQWLYNHVVMFDYLFRYNEIDNLLQRISRNYCLSLYVYTLKDKSGARHDFKPLIEYFRRKPGIFEAITTLFIKVPFYFIKYGFFVKIR